MQERDEKKDGRDDLLVEIGVEELPHSFIVPRWVLRALGVWAVASACWRHWGMLRALRVPVSDFVRGCWLNLSAVEAAMYGEREFAQDAADQAPGLAWKVQRV